MKDETVWLSLEQMAKLFGRDRTVITRHINNIFKDNELNKNEVCAKFAHTTKHGALSDKTQTRKLEYYNLDVIISVGYRVNRKRQGNSIYNKLVNIKFFNFYYLYRKIGRRIKNEWFNF